MLTRKGTIAKRYAIPEASYLEMARFQEPLPQGWKRSAQSVQSSSTGFHQAPSFQLVSADNQNVARSVINETRETLFQHTNIRII